MTILIVYLENTMIVFTSYVVNDAEEIVFLHSGFRVEQKMNIGKRRII